MDDMNILIIGNGFDLAHELPTTYMDFLATLKIIKEMNDVPHPSPPLLDAIKNETIKKSLSKFATVAEWKRPFEIMHCNLCSDFEILAAGNRQCRKGRVKCEKFEISHEYNKLITANNSWTEYFTEMYQNLNGKGWIDLEGEIEHVLDKIKNAPAIDCKDGGRKSLDTQEPIKNVMSFDFQANQDDKKRQIEFLEKNLVGFTQCLEQYLFFVNANVKSAIYSPDIKKLKIKKLLSFNYTNTYSQVYKIEDDDVCFIHGQVGKKNIVLGYQENDKFGIDEMMDIRFKKFYQRIYNRTGCEYKKWLNEENINLFFFGHSLDVTDKSILHEMITSENVRNITVFYHNEDSHASEIINLVKILGRDKIIDLAYNGKLQFKQQEAMCEA